jgi:plasmid replication initiation protein
MPLFTLIDIPTGHADENSYIKLRFNDELKPYLIKLQSRYTSIDEKILAGMDSAYTMRIYELVKENEYKSQGEFGFDEFREIIGAKEYNEDQEVIRDVIRSWQDVKRAILIPSST